jgi:hypothetical protein
MQKTGIIITLVLVTVLVVAAFIFNQFRYKICFNCDADGLYNRGLEYACSSKKTHRQAGLDFIKNAADQGHLKAELTLAELFSTALPAGYQFSNSKQRECLLQDVTPDQTTGMSYFESIIAAMEAGNEVDPVLLDNLALLYLEGIFSAEDHADRAIMLYEKAAAQGSFPAMLQLGILANSREDYNTAMQWFVKSSDDPTNAFSPLMLGDYYRYGRGVARDFRKAGEWYSTALARAEKGSSKEQTVLANTAEARLDMVNRKLEEEIGKQRVTISYRLEGGIKHFIIFASDRPEHPLGEVINNNGNITAIMNKDLELTQELSVSAQEHFSSMTKGMQWVLTTFAQNTHDNAADIIFDFVLTKS